MIAPGQPIVLEIEDGHVPPGSPRHLAAETSELRQHRQRYGDVRLYVLSDRIAAEIWPLRWEAACGVEGWMYANGGYALERPVCEQCRDALEPALAQAA